MQIIVFEEEAYYKMMEETMALMYKVINQASKEQKQALAEEEDFITTREAMKILGIKSRNRLYQLRDEKAIVYYQHGRRILYSKRSLISYLQGQRID